MSNIIEEIEHRNLTIRVVSDNSPWDPRDGDNLGTMLFFHSKYNLGDKHDYNSDDYSGWDEMEEAIIEKEGPSLILPVYMYDHSGLAFSTEPFSCPWDSGRLGFIYISETKLRENYGEITDEILERAEELLKSELDTYEKYTNGEGYGYEIYDEEDEELYSCYGFYDEEYMVEEAKAEADCIADEIEKMAPTREREELEENGQLSFEYEVG